MGDTDLRHVYCCNVTSSVDNRAEREIGSAIGRIAVERIAVVRLSLRGICKVSQEDIRRGEPVQRPCTRQGRRLAWLGHRGRRAEGGKKREEQIAQGLVGPFKDLVDSKPMEAQRNDTV